MKCPGCSGEQSKEGPTGGTRFCSHCGALFTTYAMYVGESYELVEPYFSKDPTADERAVYFDLETLGSDGLGRMHGFYDPTTRLITQVG